ncbi:glycosyltransferase [Mesorhizobium mediterraneum]|uniref:glycosyltransferase n=1 Tax=Mesorhizobium mediterraneum TaxID=43617 RepID=UPI00177CF05B|nr:glycosyltransferase [Mesorhizobium mediterraneum]
METVFWILVVIILYSLGGYGLLWIALSRLWSLQPAIPPVDPLRVTMLIAARNEEASIAEKIRSVLSENVGGHVLDILVISDASEDRTLEEANKIGSPRVCAYQLPFHEGKAGALNEGIRRLDCDVVIFSDANSIVKPGSLGKLLRHFGDPAVGGVSGQPGTAERRGGWLARAERLFWHYDGVLKAAESRIAGAVSAQGSLYAIRRSLVPYPVARDIADDLYISLTAISAGRRLVFEPGAVAVEPVTGQTRGEFMRRVRSTERGWRGILAMPRLLNPFSHGFYSIQLFSHKVLRRVVAFLLPLLLIASLALAPRSPFYAAFAAAQLIFYAIGALVLILPRGRKVPGGSVAAFFLLGHLAMAYGIMRASAGIRSSRWSPLREPGT